MKKKSNNKTHAERILTEKAFRTGLVRQSHLVFFSVYFSSFIRYKLADFQKNIFRITEDITLALAVIVAFRGSAKSTIVTTSYPIWAIIGKQQRKFVVIASQTEAKARQHLENIKRMIQNNTLLREDLGPFEEERNNLGVTSLYLPKFDAKIIIISVGQSIRGMRHGSYRPDLIILDDIEDTDSVRTQEGRDKTWEWLTKDILPSDDLGTRIIAVGNLLHEDSVLKRIQQKINNKEVDHAAYVEYPIIDDDNTILWLGKYPDMNAIDQQRKRLMNNVAWSVEFLLKIVAEDEQIIKQEWIHYYDELPSEHAEKIFNGTDLAIKQGINNDYTAMVPINVYYHDSMPYIYVLPNIVNERMSFLETIEKMKTIADLLQAVTLIEDISYQGSAVEQLAHDNYAVEGVQLHGKKKEVRLMAVSHLFQSGHILFPRIGAELLIRQILGFGKEKHDDLMDALTLAANHAVDNRPRLNGWSQIVKEGLKEMEDHPERFNPEQRAWYEYWKKMRGL